MRRAQAAEKEAAELRKLISQRLDASHDECCQREASAVQRAEAAEAELAKMRAEREGMVLVPMEPTEAMIDHANTACIAANFSVVGRQLAPIAQERIMLAAAYRAMLAASQPPAEREEPSK